MSELKKGLEARIGGRRGFRRMVFIPSLLSIFYSLLRDTMLVRELALRLARHISQISGTG